MADRTAAPPVPALQSADLESFRVDSRLEIVSLLSQLCKQGVMLNASIGAGAEGEFILTSLLAVRPGSNELIAEFGADADANRRALAATRLNFVASHEGIKIEFSAQPVTQTRLQGRDAFVLPLPARLQRWQRRGFFRVATPTKAIQCIIGPRSDFPVAGASVNIVNISCGGIGLSYQGQAGPFEVGSRAEGCSLLLPDAAAVTVDLVVRSIEQSITRAGTPLTYLGCEFVHIAERDRAPIQRYIHKIERDRNRLR